MKKTILALTLASLSSASVMAADEIDHGDQFYNSDSFEVIKGSDHNDYLFVDGKIAGKVVAGEEGNFLKLEGDKKLGYEEAFITRNEDGTFRVVAKAEGHNSPELHKGKIVITPENKVIDDTANIVDTVDASGAAVERVKAGDTEIELRDGQGNVVETIDKHNIDQYERDFLQLSDEEKVQAMKHIKDAADKGQIVEGNTPKPRPEPEPINDDARMDWVNDRINGAAGAIVNEGAKAYNDLDSRIAGNTKRIDSLENDMKAMGNKMLDLEDRMDGVVATSHAVTNARPMVQDAGEFAMGVGMGAAGSKQAVAFGGAYQFNTNWSASTTVNYETAGKRSKSQLSAGAGVQYRFK